MIRKTIKQWLERILKPTSEKDAKRLLKIREQYVRKDNGIIQKWLLECKNARINYRNAASIPLTTDIGRSICFPHGLAGIFISLGAQIGDDCTIFQNVTIGSNTAAGSKHPGAPIVGNDVLIGAGAVILGGIRIGNHVRIGANTTVVEDVPDNCTVVSSGGVRIIPSVVDRDNSFVGYRKWRKQQLDESHD